MHFSAKKLFLIGFIFLLLVGIPATVYLLQQQQETRSHAEKSTNLSFFPTSSDSGPKTANVGDTFPLDIMIDPGTNIVTLVKLEIDYDPDKLQVVPNSFVANSAVFPTVSAGPVYSSGKVVVSLSAGFDATKAIQTKQRAGTIKFKALAVTDPTTPTRVTFSSVNTIVTSLGSNDQANENVFSGSSPAVISIGTAATASATPSESPTDVPTGQPTDVPTATPTSAAVTGTLTPSPTGSSGTNPVCSTFSADTTSGQAPLSVNFTAAGTSTDPNTISKVTFNFGDGQVSDVTTGGGIGTNSVSTQLAHSYSTAGTFQASAVLTDNVNGVSNTTSCTQTISVAGASTATAPATATPTMAPTGSLGTTLGIGAIAGFLMIGGALLFFML